MEKKQIKVAILSSTNISFYTATGALMYYLFQEFRDDQVVQVTKWKHDTSELGKFDRVIPFRDFLWAARNAGNPLVSFPAKVIRQLCFLCKFFIGNRSFVLKSLRSFEPDILYLRIVSDPYYYLPLTLYLKKKTGLPLCIHFMDDFEGKLEAEAGKSPLAWIPLWLYRRYLRKIVAVADCGFVISTSMQEAFEKRYGMPFRIAHNGIKTSDRAFYSTVQPRRPSGSFTLLWAGSLVSAKDEVIIEHIAGAIRKINREGNLSAPVDLLLNVPSIYLQKARKIAEKFPFVRFQEYQPMEKYKQMLADVHLLLIGRDFDERSRAFMQYSFHNKLPDFLASGTPVLCIAPAWDNTLKLFRKYGLGETVDSDQETEIGKTILKILSDYPESLARASMASGKAWELLSMDRIRSAFENELINCAAMRNNPDQ